MSPPDPPSPSGRLGSERWRPSRAQMVLAAMISIYAFGRLWWWLGVILIVLTVTLIGDFIIYWRAKPPPRKTGDRGAERE